MGLFTDFRFFASFHLSRGLKLGGRTNLAFHFASALLALGHTNSTHQTVIQVFSLKLNLASFCYNCFWPLISFLATGCFLGTTSSLGLQDLYANHGKSPENKHIWLEDIFSFKNSPLSVDIGSFSGGISVHISKI